MWTSLCVGKGGMGSCCCVFGSLTQVNGPPDFLASVYTAAIIARLLFLIGHSLTQKYSLARHSGHPIGGS